MAYAGLRAVIVGRTLGPEHGINPYHYFLVDFLAAGVEGWSTGKGVACLIDRERSRAKPFFFVAAIMFITPDLYIFAFGHHLPWYVYAIIGTVVSITGTLSVIGVIRKVHKAWALNARGQCDPEPQ